MPTRRRAPSFIPLFLLLQASVLTDSYSQVRNHSEPTGGTWKTIILPSSDAIRLPAPPSPGSAQESAACAQLRSLQQIRTPAIEAAVAFWNRGRVVRWNEIARNLVIKYKTNPPQASRVYALLSAGQYD